MEYISDIARERIRSRGISDKDTEACIANHHDLYVFRSDNVYCAVLDDGRNIKVQVRPGSVDRIVNAFIHH